MKKAMIGPPNVAKIVFVAPKLTDWLIRDLK